MANAPAAVRRGAPPPRGLITAVGSDAEPALDLDARFDPRTGNTGEWVGGDIAASVPFPDGRVLWLFGDCFWAVPGTTPSTTTRLGTQFRTGSIAVQDGPDLATADLTFHRPPGNRAVYFQIPGGTHTGWPQSGLFIGDDLYVFCIRVLDANPYGVEAGWSVHRIADAATTDPATWDPTLLYESGNTDTRPTLSPYIGGDGYVYAFALKHLHGVMLARWSQAALVAGNVASIQYAGLGGWGSDPAAGFQFVESVLGTEGTFHQRPDGRWVFVDTGAAFPNAKIQARLSEKAGGVYGPSNRYLPVEPLFQVGDHVDLPGDGGVGAVIIAAPTPTTRTVGLFDVWGAGVLTRNVSALVARTSTLRYIYDPPINTINPGTWVYGARAHPELAGEGLVIGYSTNSVPAQGVGPGSAWQDMDIYWPRFIRVRPPRPTDLTVADGTASWLMRGTPDRLLIQVGGGAWTELDPTALSAPVTGSAVSLRAIGIGGETTVSS